MSNASHFISALLAILVLISALMIGEVYAGEVESRYVRALTPVYGNEVRQDLGLSQAAIERADFLVFLGSSELNAGRPFNARELLGSCPTGFSVYGTGGDYADIITYIQSLAGLRSNLKGKKIVVALTPGSFLDLRASEKDYAVSFSVLEANELVFRADINMSLKQAAARRMLEYPTTLEQNPLLTFGLKNLANDDLASRALYWAALPLGQFNTWLLRLENHRHTLEHISKHPELEPDIACQAEKLDWAKFKSEATQMAAQNIGDNPFGITDELWQSFGKSLLKQKNDFSDQEFLDRLQRSAEWEDLDLLLRMLDARGAVPLIISMPLNGLFYDYRGVSAAARAEYYQRLRQVGAQYGVKVVTFENHEYDRLFFQDVSHPSMKGWVFYDQVLDEFYHSALP